MVLIHRGCMLGGPSATVGDKELAAQQLSGSDRTGRRVTSSAADGEEARDARACQADTHWVPARSHGGEYAPGQEKCSCLTWPCTHPISPFHAPISVSIILENNLRHQLASISSAMYRLKHFICIILTLEVTTITTPISQPGNRGLCPLPRS